jgi:hypothetical protein
LTGCFVAQTSQGLFGVEDIRSMSEDSGNFVADLSEAITACIATSYHLVICHLEGLLPD